jgi:hypothetical protein
MTLQEYFLSQPRGAKTAMAYALNISKTWLSLVVSGKELPSPALAVAISAYTKNKVSTGTARECNPKSRLITGLLRPTFFCDDNL